MSQRERLIGCIVAALVVVLAAWLVGVSPERSKASGLLTQIASERMTLAGEQSQLALARQARASYPAEVHALEVLLDAIPSSDQEPQLIRLVNALENGHVINWDSTAFSSGSVDGFQAINLSFSFEAGYLNLQSFIAALDALDRSNGTNLVTNGRLATVNSLQLSPATHGQTTASVTMTVYDQTGGAATGATGAVTTTAATQ